MRIVNRKYLIVGLTLLTAGIFWGELDLMLWAGRAGLDAKPTAMARLSARSSSDLKLWIRCDDRFSTTYVEFDLGSAKAIEMLGQTLGDGSGRTDKFEELEQLLMQESNSVYLFQQIRFFEIELGEWYVRVNNNNVEEPVGARSFGKAREFTIVKTASQRLYSAASDSFRANPVLLSFTIGRAAWDLVHIAMTMCVGAACSRLLAGLHKKNG